MLLLRSLLYLPFLRFFFLFFIILIPTIRFPSILALLFQSSIWMDGARFIVQKDAFNRQNSSFLTMGQRKSTLMRNGTPDANKWCITMLLSRGI